MSDFVTVESEIAMPQSVYDDPELRYMVRAVDLFEGASADDDLRPAAFARLVGYIVDRYGTP